MAVRKEKILFFVQYKVKKGDTPINMRVSTEGLEELHRILCSMDSFRTPMADWDTVEIHEMLEGGKVASIPQRHLADLFDWQYGFGVKKEEDTPSPITPVHVVRRKGKQPKVSMSIWWKEKSYAD